MGDNSIFLDHFNNDIIYFFGTDIRFMNLAKVV